MELANRSLQVAATQIGVTESPKGSNSGKEVNQYLKAVGLTPGFAWCMAFVYWCVDQAAKEAGVINPLIKTAGVLNQWNTVNLKKLTKPDQYKAGQIFIMKFAGGLGHTGFIESIQGASATTIEGNTNADGSREGYQVCRRRRLLSSFSGTIQLS